MAGVEVLRVQIEEPVEDVEDSEEGESEEEEEDVACSRCGEIIESASLLVSLGKHWHPDCFRCSGCSKQLGTGTFKSSEGKPWCAECYLQLKAPRCYGCEQPIEGKHMSVMGMTLHEQCFKCEICGAPVKVFQPAENEHGKVMIACMECHKTLDKVDSHEEGTCAKCHAEFDENDVPYVWEEKSWHPGCFVCTGCSDPLGPDNLPIKQNNKPYCQRCRGGPVHEENRCQECRHLIKDVVVKVLGAKYHRHCLSCAYCGVKLVKKGQESTLRIDEMGHPCCDPCYNKRKNDKLIKSKLVDASWLHSTSKDGNGFLQVRIRSALDLFKNIPGAREAYIVFRIGLQMIYTGKRIVAKAQSETVWDEVWEFRKIDVTDTLFELELMWKDRCLGKDHTYLKTLIPGISTQEYNLENGTLFVEFTWRPSSAATREEAFQPHWRGN